MEGDGNNNNNSHTHDDSNPVRRNIDLNAEPVEEISDDEMVDEEPTQEVHDQTDDDSSPQSGQNALVNNSYDPNYAPISPAFMPEYILNQYASVLNNTNRPIGNRTYGIMYVQFGYVPRSPPLYLVDILNQFAAVNSYNNQRRTNPPSARRSLTSTNMPNAQARAPAFLALTLPQLAQAVYQGRLPNVFEV